MEKRLFTSESVTEGHPDKICDAISDAILDALLEQDPMSRVACETCTTTGYVMVMGEITSNAHIDFQQVVRDTVREIGYDRAKYGFDADTCAVVTAIDKQSTDIAMGVDKALEAKENNMSDEEIDAIGAGDQGMMFGYASDETEEYMPYPAVLTKNGTGAWESPVAATGSALTRRVAFPPVQFMRLSWSPKPNICSSFPRGRMSLYPRLFFSCRIDDTS